MNAELYDTIIIGGGPGGVAAAVYAARKRIKTLVVTESFGGQSAVSRGVENWIGETRITGPELAEKLERQIRSQEGIEIKAPEKAVAVAAGPDHTFEVRTERSGTYRAKAVIIASGAQSRRLNVPGEDEFDGKGVTYCSTCDAPLFKDSSVAVVGSGNSALEAAIDLAAYAKDIYLLIRRDEPKGDPVNREKVAQSQKVHMIRNAEVQEIFGEQGVKGLRYKEKKTGEIRELQVEGVFVEIGSTPNSDFLDGLVRKTQSGEIVVDRQTGKTSKEGIFAVGDVTDDLYKQNNAAAGDGVRAALSAYHYVSNFKKYSPCDDCEEKEEETLDAFSEMKKAYREKVERRLNEWGAGIDELKAKSDRSKAELRSKYEKLIEDLRTKQQDVRRGLTDLKESGEETWEGLKSRTEESFNELKEALDQTALKLRESQKEIGEKASKKKKAYLEKTESQLRQWKREIDGLKAKAEKSKTEAKIKYLQQVKELRSKEKIVKEKLREVKASGDEAWEDLKGGVGHTMGELKKTLKQTVSRFKKS